MTRRAGMFALFAALFFTMSSAVKARGSGNAAPALSLKDCLDIALRESEMIKIASEAVIAASGLKRQARGAFMPDIRLQGVYTKLPEVPSILGFEMGSEDNYSGKLAMIQPLFTWGRISQTYRQARYGEDIAGESYRQARNELCFNVKTAFYSVLLARHLKNIAAESLSVMERHYEVTRALYSEGKVSGLDVSRVKVQTVNSRTNLIKAENELRLAKKSLISIINDPATADMEISGELSASPDSGRELDEYVETAFRSRPELLSAGLRTKMGESFVKLARAGHMPSLALVGNYEYAKPYNFIDEWDSSWNVSCSLTFPLFSGFSSFGEIKAAKSRFRQSQMSESLLRNSIKLEVERAFLNRQNAAERIRAQEENVKAAKENLAIVEKRYGGGLVSDLELRDTQLAFTQAQLQYYTALFDWNIADAELKKATGRCDE